MSIFGRCCMRLMNIFGFDQARDKPVRNYSNGEYTFNFGRWQ